MATLSRHILRQRAPGYWGITGALIFLALRNATLCHLSNSASSKRSTQLGKRMSEQEAKPLIVQLYAELLTRLNAETHSASDENEIAEFAELLANQFILGIKEADELDELLSLSPEEIGELFNKCGY